MNDIEKKPTVLCNSPHIIKRPVVVYDCDCACAINSQAQDRKTFFSLSDILKKPQNAVRFRFSSQWQGIYLSHGESSFVVLNNPAYALWESFQEPHSFSTLDAEEMNVAQEMVNLGLLISPNIEIQPSAFQQSLQLSAWLHITDHCNLRCAYCYLPHKKEDMTLETGKAAIEATFRAARVNYYQRVKLKYAGGEPLLRFPVVVELYEYAQKLSKDYNLEFDGVILSNGTLLTGEIVRTMQDLNLRLMISLDGMGDWHDAQRPYAGGRGTFEDVAEAVELALSYELIPDISITVSGRNAEGLPEIVDWVLERNLPFSLNFYRQNNFSVSWEGLKLEEDKIIAGMLAAFKIIEKNLPSNSLLST